MVELPLAANTPSTYSVSVVTVVAVRDTVNATWCHALSLIATGDVTDTPTLPSPTYNATAPLVEPTNTKPAALPVTPAVVPTNAGVPLHDGARRCSATEKDVNLPNRRDAVLAMEAYVDDDTTDRYVANDGDGDGDGDTMGADGDGDTDGVVPQTYDSGSDAVVEPKVLLAATASVTA